MATVFRSPIIQRRASVYPGVAINSQALVWQNPLLTTLKSRDKFFGEAGQVPDHDWPVPRGVVRPNDLRTWVNKSNDLLFGAVAPFGNNDWPVPGRSPYPIHLRTWLDPLKLNLLGQDQFFSSPGMGPSYDWPLPHTRVYPIDLRRAENNLLQTTLAIIQAIPFSMLDWPVPRDSSGRGPSLRTWINQLRLDLLGKDQFFGEAGQPLVYDWPNPRISPPPISLRHWDNQLLQTTLAPLLAAPFSMADWPVPKSSGYPLDLRTFFSVLKLNLAGKDQFFGEAGQPLVYDWPNPRRAIPGMSLRQLDNNLLQTTLAAPPPAPGVVRDERILASTRLTEGLGSEKGLY